MTQENSNKLKNHTLTFDLIRTACCLLVFTGHYGAWHDFPSFPRSTTIAISMFSFISAYLLTSRYKEFHWNYYRKRILKIYPAVISSMIFVGGLLWLFGKFSLQRDVLAYLLGFGSLIYRHETISRFGQGMWYVSFILLAYMLLPVLSRILYHFAERGKNWVLFVFLVGITVLGFITFFFPWSPSQKGYVLFTESFAWFWVGIFYNIADQRYLISANKKVFFGAFFLSWGGMVICHLYPSHLLQYFSIVLIPFWFFPISVYASEKLNEKGGFARFFSFVSGISFEIYLLHFYFIGEFVARINVFKLSPGLYLVYAFCLVVLSSVIVNYMGQKIARVMSRLI